MKGTREQGIGNAELGSPVGAEKLRQPAASAILAGMKQRFDLIVIPQEGDKQVRWPVLKDEA
jgi:hypothetical protein